MDIGRAPALMAAAVALSAWPMTAEAAGRQDGLYAVVSAGGAVVDFDCGFYLDCDRRTTSVVRGALGWRAGSWSIEGWMLRLGNTTVGDALVPRSLSLRGWGGVAAWHWPLSDRSEMLVRAGLLNMRHARDGDGVNTSTAPLLGVGWILSLTPQAQLELAWDYTMADGNNVSSTLLQLLTVGLRWRF